jgi:predicted TIM-barrel fold metal-dependent hydrolase
MPHGRQRSRKGGVAMSAKANQIVIDVHSHVFNALCLPLEGIILEYLDEDESHNFMTSYLKRAAAKALAKLIEQLAGSGRFGGVRTAPQWVAKVDRAVALEALIELLTKSIVDEFIAEMKKKKAVVAHDHRRADGFAAAFDWVVTEFGDADATKGPPALDALEGLGTFDQASLAQWREPWSDAVDKFLHALFGVDKKGEGYLRFFCLLLTPQHTIIDGLLASYSEPRKANEAEVRLFVHLMMDMEKAYLRYGSCPPVWDFPTRQVPEMIELHKKQDGRVLWFVAFDPRRARNIETGIKTVRDALAKGCCGVKFYPSLGYKPDGNKKKWVQEAVTELLDYCDKNKVPILAHCQRGPFKGDDTWDQFSNPEFWGDALRLHNNLILCLAHAGGGIYKTEDRKTEYGWFSKDAKEWNEQNHWAKKVVELCVSSRYPNVYCDLSAMWEVIDAPVDLKPPAPERFAGTLKRLLESNAGFSNKIMYGSDWHMPSVLGRSSKYLAFFLELFKDPKLSSYADHFFFKNARHFLRLRQYLNANIDNLSAEAYDRLTALADIP